MASGSHKTQNTKHKTQERIHPFKLAFSMASVELAPTRSLVLVAVYPTLAIQPIPAMALLINWYERDRQECILAP
jgi:hypothetical protein